MQYTFKGLKLQTDFKQCVIFLIISLLTDRDCYHKILVEHPLKIGR